VDVAGECDGLSSLSSLRKGVKGTSAPNERKLGIEFSSTWKASLDTLEWTSGDENLACNDALLERLQGARQVISSSTELTSSWIVKLLSSSSRLEEVHLRMAESSQVDNIPPMNLPNLSYLFLNPPPKTTQIGDSSLFFKNLNSPRLKMQLIDRINPQDLSFLSTTSSPEELILYDLPITDSASAKAAASALVESIKDWSKFWALR